MIEVQGKVFQTKKALEEFVRSSLISIGYGNTLPSELKAFMDELLTRHPEHDEKRGMGVQNYWVVKNPLNPKAVALEIERIDGSRVDVSWLTCVKGSGQTIDVKLRAAMRTSIASQIQVFKREALRDAPMCAICGDHEQGPFWHVDHDPIPFEQLVRDFLKTCKAPTEFADHPEHNMATFRSEDAAFEQQWCEYHLIKAKLQLTCAQCNLRKARRRGAETSGSAKMP